MRGQTGGNDSWETALLSLSFCCGHFETSGAICLAARCAGGKEKEEEVEEEKAFISDRSGMRGYVGNASRSEHVRWWEGERNGGKWCFRSCSLAAKMSGDGVLAGRRSFGGGGGLEAGQRADKAAGMFARVHLMCRINQDAVCRTARRIFIATH